MGSIKSVGDAQQGRGFLNTFLILGTEFTETLVTGFGQGLSMVPRKVGQDPFLRFGEAVEWRVGDYLAPVFVVPTDTFRQTNVMQKRPKIKKIPPAFSQPMEIFQLIEKHQRESGNLLGMLILGLMRFEQGTNTFLL